MDASALTNLVYGIVAGVPVPYPLPNPDACNGCNLNCPVKKDQEYTYINTLPVKQDYPDVSAVLKFQPCLKSYADLQYIITLSIECPYSKRVHAVLLSLKDQGW